MLKAQTSMRNQILFPTERKNNVINFFCSKMNVLKKNSSALTPQ